MRQSDTAARRRIPTAVTVLLSVVITLAVVAGAVIALLGRDGLAVVQGWLLARWAFVEEDADLSEAADQALSGMVTGLGDRWSYYVDEESYAALQDSRANEYLGIGVTVTTEREEGLSVLSVTPDGPADRAGVVAGDVITAVDGVSVAGEARFEGTSLIGGEAGTQQKLTLLGAEGTTREVTVTLEYIQVAVVQGTMLDNGMGLVTIRNFNSRATEEFEAAVTELVEQGASALLFDVRNDGGGYVRELTQMLDFLLPEGPVFQSRPRWGSATVIESDADCIDLPFGVLVNGQSYSAAELFAAQLRESAGAPIVGEVTSGKGYSQRTFPLLNGGALGLSTARYSTGSGVSLVGTGLTPDVEVSLTEEEAAKLAAGQLAPEEDPQLQALIDQMERQMTS